MNNYLFAFAVRLAEASDGVISPVNNMANTAVIASVNGLPVIIPLLAAFSVIIAIKNAIFVKA